MIHVLLYVDSMILIIFFHDLHNTIMSLYNSQFAIKDLGSPQLILDIVVTRYVTDLFLYVRKYLKLLDHEQDTLNKK